jgi:hypothetical protein
MAASVPRLNCQRPVRERSRRAGHVAAATSVCTRLFVDDHQTNHLARPQLPSRPDRATGSSRWHQDLHKHERPICQRSRAYEGHSKWCNCVRTLGRPGRDPARALYLGIIGAGKKPSQTVPLKRQAVAKQLLQASEQPPRYHRAEDKEG